MDLSISKIKQNKAINFKGVKGDFDAKSAQVFRFSTPSYKNNEKPYLEITFLDRELNKKGMVDTNRYVPSDTYKIAFDGKNTIEIPQDFIKEAGFDAFAYRYIFVNSDNNTVRTAVDALKTIDVNGEKNNIIEIGDNFGVTPQGGAMYHVFVDSVGYDPNQTDKKTKDFIRTHANKLGGSIKGLAYLVKQGYFDSYKYIISNPDIGADPTSAHKYWPNNQYQCTNMDDFKDLNFELFKRGKGYVADGAFTSQSLQSPMVQHVLKWGEKSPFYHMLKVDEKMQLGVIPENPEAVKNVGIRLINSPLLKDYDKNKPTLIQFVDDRLLDESQRKDTKKPIDKYGKTNPDDHYDSVGYQDTIHPFYFEIGDNEFDEKLKIFKNSNYIMLKDLSTDEKETLFAFRGGDIVNRYAAANATYWDGNVDIVKMNLSNPDVSNLENLKGFEAARDYLLGVATFWSEAIQTDLLKRTAKLSEDEILQIAKNSNLTNEEFEAIKQNVIEDKFVSPILKQNKTVNDYIDEFPLQSIETSPELSAIFSEPDFKNELFDKGTYDLLVDYVDDVINEVIPEQYKNDSEFKTYVTKIYSDEIIKTIYAQSILSDSVDKEGVINIDKLREKATLKSLLTYMPANPENERHQVVNKIRRNLSKVDNNAIIQKIKNELKNVTPKDFKLAEAVILQTKSGLNWRFDAAKDIGDLAVTMNNNLMTSFEDIWNGTAQVPGVEQFWNEFITRIKSYNPSAYIIAEITTLGDYLQWNDFDSMMNYDEKLANTFLMNLGEEILKEEPNSKLGDLTRIYMDTTRPYEQRKEAWQKALITLYSDGYGNKYETFRDYENNLPWVKEQNFLEQIGATTSSNYDKYFNRISYFVGVDPEEGGSGIKDDNTGKLSYLKENTERLLAHDQPNTAILSHTFVDNHDKPRVLHTLPLNMELVVTGLNLGPKSYRQKDLTEIKDEALKEKICEIAGRKDLQNINPMAAAVGLMMSEKINNSSLSDEEKSKLNSSLKKLINGEKNGQYDSRRARAFGFLPYEITVRDLFKGADINDEEKIEAFNKLIMDEPMYLEDKIWQLLAALIGTPTLYYGTEYAQTGYETYSKNDLVGNRNRALHERKNDGIYAKYYDKISAVAAMSSDIKLSALRNGFPESLELTTSNDIEMYPIYRKDERNSEVISVITNFGIEQGKLSKDQGHKFSESITPKEVSSIKLKNKTGYCPIDESVNIKRMVYSPEDKKYITEKVDYMIKNGSIVRSDGKNIQINDTVLTFYVDKPDKSRFVPSYNGAH